MLRLSLWVGFGVGCSAVNSRAIALKINRAATLKQARE
jgi:hypothetical protein